MLTETEYNIIKEYVRRSLLRVLGVNVSVNIRENEPNRFFLETSEFNTFPVIFEKIRVIGYGYIGEYVDEGDEGVNIVTKIVIHFDYDFNYFNGGRNGTNLGCMKFYRYKEGHICIGDEFTLSNQSVINGNDLN